MFTEKTLLPFIKTYIDNIDQELKKTTNGLHLSMIQKIWLSFCLMGILLTNSICWAKFERMSLQSYKRQALSWMFRHTKLPWNKLLTISVKVILKRFNILEGILVVDDKDISRSKNAKKIFRLHKMKDKKTGGYILGQNIVMIYFVSNKVSIPVSFAYYAPNPEIQKWNAKIKKLKQSKAHKSTFPPKPQLSCKYPKKYELAAQLLQKFNKEFPDIKIKAVLADCLFGNRNFINSIESLWKNIQIITKIKKSQNLFRGNKKYSCEAHANSYSNWKQKIRIRGHEMSEMITGGGRLYLPSHSTKRFVISFKYTKDDTFRHLMATNLTWNMKEIIEVFSLRWLIEVFFEDWSLYNGFCNESKQCDVEGSLRPSILSLLFDHCFLFHAEQTFFLENKCSLATFGTLVEKNRVSALLLFIEKILSEKNPKKKLQKLINNLDNIYPLRKSKKHFSGVNMKYMPTKLVA